VKDHVVDIRLGHLDQFDAGRLNSPGRTSARRGVGKLCPHCVHDAWSFWFSFLTGWILYHLSGLVRVGRGGYGRGFYKTLSWRSTCWGSRQNAGYIERGEMVIRSSVGDECEEPAALAVWFPTGTRLAEVCLEATPLLRRTYLICFRHLPPIRWARSGAWGQGKQPKMATIGAAGLGKVQAVRRRERRRRVRRWDIGFYLS
jgi:hypothetical protein